MISGLIAIVCTSNRESIVKDAILSVEPHVNAFLVVDLGITDNTLEVIREAAGTKPVFSTSFEWQDDMAAARNHGLDFAATLGDTYGYSYDWAMILDTDERIDWKGSNVHQFLSETKADVALVMHDSGQYPKARFIRLPTTRRYENAIHESLPTSVLDPVIHPMVFHELLKTPEQDKERYEYIAAHLAGKDDGRSCYYLGDALLGLGDDEGAIKALVRCIEHDGYREEVAFAAFRAASALYRLERYKEAIDVAVKGLRRFPGSAECLFLASAASYKLADLDAAWEWGMCAVTHGRYKGDGGSILRLGFQYPPALYECPLDVLRAVCETRGNPELAGRYRIEHENARAMRLGGTP